MGVDTESRTDLVRVDAGQWERAYPNHSQFYSDWPQVPIRSPVGEPDPDRLASVDGGKTVPTDDVDIGLPEAGYLAAQDRLDGFCEAGIYSYDDTRDDLARAVEAPTQAVSRMSPYLAAGMIGIREVWTAASEAHDDLRGDERRHVEKCRFELSWRGQNYHLLHYNRDLPVANYREFPNEIAWRDDEEGFEAWTAGQTGYPLVDAGMRQLTREGYVHNRPRQVVASFLTKHLLVDWRRGARYFTEQLIDQDYATNYGNWQWIASTGTDSVDVRLFDPVSRMSKDDSGATFVTEYVPELRDVPAGKVVNWPTLPDSERAELSAEYPHPILDGNRG